MKLKVQIEAEIEIEHHKLFHGIGEPMMACGSECKRKHLKNNKDPLGLPICTLFGQEVGYIREEKLSEGCLVRCIKCFTATANRDLTDKIQMDREVMLASIINRLGSKPESIEKIVDKFLRIGKVHHKVKTRLKKRYNFDLEEWFDNYLKSKYNLYYRQFGV